MTLVDADTGEIAVMSESDARELIDSLKRAVEIAERQIIRAWEGRAWLALGYESWDEMAAHEFRSHYVKIAPDERRAKAIEMAKVGMSTRAIASAVGVSKSTVANDLSGSGVQDWTPDDQADDEPRQVTGLDGKTYTITDATEKGAPDEASTAAADPASSGSISDGGIVGGTDVEGAPAISPIDAAIAEFPFLADYPPSDVIPTAEALRAIPEGPQRDRRIEAAKTWPAAVAAADTIAAAGDDPIDYLDAAISRLADAAGDLVGLPLADLIADTDLDLIDDQWRPDIDRVMQIVTDLHAHLNRPRTLRSVQ